jgi:hypothetical protein
MAQGVVIRLRLGAGNAVECGVPHFVTENIVKFYATEMSISFLLPR